MEIEDEDDEMLRAPRVFHKKLEPREGIKPNKMMFQSTASLKDKVRN